MGAVFAALTPLALGVAASPLPVVAVLIILITKRARVGGIALAACWVLGNTVAIAITTSFAGSVRVPRQGLDLGAEGAFTLLLGVGLIVTGMLARRGRRRTPPREGSPAWVASVDNLSPTGAGLVAFSNATTSPKNLALTITAGAIIARADLRPAEVATVTGYYVFVASLTIVVPVVLYLVGGQRSVDVLRKWRDAVTAHAAAVMEVLLFVIGIGMSARGLYNLLS